MTGGLRLGRRLPVDVTPSDEEAADGYLERVADANNLTPAAVQRLTGLATVTQLRRSAFRDDAGGPALARGPDGWVPGAIVQACPRCLAEDGIWRAPWYDPLTTICIRHSNLLISRCSGCRRPLRDTTHVWLRPIGTGTCCGNPTTAGNGARCTTDLAALTVTDADSRVRAQQARLASPTVTILGTDQAPEKYRQSLKAIAVLLLHIAAHSDAAPAVWDLPDTKRWHLRPPHDPRVRAEVLVEADRILAVADINTAAATFQPWFNAIPHVWEGPMSWALDHTRATPAVTHLLTAASSPQRRLAHRLSARRDLTLEPRLIPQRIPVAIAPAAGSGLSASTARGFAALCLARAQPGITSWAHSATLLDLPAQAGVDLARTASAHLNISRDEWLDHLNELAQRLRDTPIDHRQRERAVRDIDDGALVRALRSVRPGTRASSVDLIRTWLWEHWANADPTNTPAETVSLTRRSRARYAQFKHDLDPIHGVFLMGVVSGPHRHAEDSRAKSGGGELETKDEEKIHK